MGPHGTFMLCTANSRCSYLAMLLLHSLGLLVKRLVMGGAAGFFLELMLFIGPLFGGCPLVGGSSQYGIYSPLKTYYT